MIRWRKTFELLAGVASALFAASLLIGCSQTTGASPNVIQRVQGETPAAPAPTGFWAATILFFNRLRRIQGKRRRSLTPTRMPILPRTMRSLLIRLRIGRIATPHYLRISSRYSATISIPFWRKTSAKISRSLKTPVRE